MMRPRGSAVPEGAAFRARQLHCQPGMHVVVAQGSGQGADTRRELPRADDAREDHPSRQPDSDA